MTHKCLDTMCAFLHVGKLIWERFREDHYGLTSILLWRFGTFRATLYCNCLVAKIPSRLEQKNIPVNRNPRLANRTWFAEFISAARESSPTHLTYALPLDRRTTSLAIRPISHSQLNVVKRTEVATGFVRIAWAKIVCWKIYGERREKNAEQQISTTLLLLLLLLLYLYCARNKITQLSTPTHAQLQCHRLKFIKNHLKNSYMFRSTTIFREFTMSSLKSLLFWPQLDVC
jgi:hypothetical protein